MRRVLIVIPTCRRPDGLGRALACLQCLEVNAEVAVLVAENDPAGGEGRAVVERLALHYRFKLGCIEVAEPGVSQVRNALFAAALAMPDVDFVACLDDDEWPSAQWLQALLDMQDRTGAEIVGGTVLPALPAGAPAWAGDFELYRLEQPDGPSRMVWGICNALVSRATIERMGPVWFDPALGPTGGEDMEFFARARAAGARFAWASAALMHEDVPTARLSSSWVARRAFRIGSTNTLVDLRWRYRRLGRSIVLAKALGRLVHALAAVLRGPFEARRRMEGLAIAARACGEISGLFGLRYREYGQARGPASGSALVSNTVS